MKKFLFLIPIATLAFLLMWCDLSLAGVVLSDAEMATLEGGGCSGKKDCDTDGCQGNACGIMTPSGKPGPCGDYCSNVERPCGNDFECMFCECGCNGSGCDTGVACETPPPDGDKPSRGCQNWGPCEKTHSEAHPAGCTGVSCSPGPPVGEGCQEFGWTTFGFDGCVSRECKCRNGVGCATHCSLYCSDFGNYGECNGGTKVVNCADCTFLFNGSDSCGCSTTLCSRDSTNAHNECGNPDVAPGTPNTDPNRWYKYCATSGCCRPDCKPRNPISPSGCHNMCSKLKQGAHGGCNHACPPYP